MKTSRLLAIFTVMVTTSWILNFTSIAFLLWFGARSPFWFLPVAAGFFNVYSLNQLFGFYRRQRKLRKWLELPAE